MTFLNAQQLAFILDIKKEDARARMCNAWCKAKGIPNEKDREGPKVAGAAWEKKKLKDPYPQAMPVEILSEQLNLPTLQAMMYDIHHNFLKRPATRKWILCDYPEKQKENAQKAGKNLHRLPIPKGLKSLLSTDTVTEIGSEWSKRYGISAV